MLLKIGDTSAGLPAPPNADSLEINFSGVTYKLAGAFQRVFSSEQLGDLTMSSVIEEQLPSRPLRPSARVGNTRPWTLRVILSDGTDTYAVGNCRGSVGYNYGAGGLVTVRVVLTCDSIDGDLLQ